MIKFFQNRSKVLIPLILILLVLALMLSLNQKSQAPEVTFTTIEGKTIKMADLKGKMVLVNFWATSCSGCIAEMPELITTYNQYQSQGLELVAVAMSYDPPSHVLNFSQKNKLPFPVMHDSFEEIASKFKDVRLTPTTYVINKEGEIIKQIIGVINFKELTTLLDTELKAKKAA